MRVSVEAGHSPFKTHIFLIILLGFLLSSCNKMGEYRSFKWAEVDERQIKNTIKDIAIIQNKKQYDEINKMYEDARDRREDISKAISRKKDDERDSCYQLYPPQTSGDGKKSPSRRDMSEGRRERIMISSSDGVFDVGSDSPYQKCIENIKSSESINSLQAQYDEYDKFLNDKNKYDQEISKISDEAATRLIEDYAKDKYELIIKKDRDIILFSKERVKLDVTADVIDHVRNSQLDLVVKNFVGTANQ